MNKFRLLSLNWWILHIVAVFLVLWLGHAVRFVHP
jgi:hypothetical protein